MLPINSNLPANFKELTKEKTRSSSVLSGVVTKKISSKTSTLTKITGLIGAGALAAGIYYYWQSNTQTPYEYALDCIKHPEDKIKFKNCWQKYLETIDPKTPLENALNCLRYPEDKIKFKLLKGESYFSHIPEDTALLQQIAPYLFDGTLKDQNGNNVTPRKQPWPNHDETLLVQLSSENPACQLPNAIYLPGSVLDRSRLSGDVLSDQCLFPKGSKMINLTANWIPPTIEPMYDRAFGYDY